MLLWRILGRQGHTTRSAAREGMAVSNCQRYTCPRLTKESDQAVKAQPPFDAVIHTASPFHDNFESPEDILDPAINGTRGLLSAIKACAPTVKRIVLTSSFAAMIDSETNPRIYDESSWNPVTLQEAMADRSIAYRGSKVSFVHPLRRQMLRQESNTQTD